MFSLINAPFQRGEGTGVSDERLVESEVDLNADTHTHTHRALLGAVVHKLTANVHSDNPTVLSSSSK